MPAIQIKSAIKSQITNRKSQIDKVPVDRDETLRRAEKLLRQGKLDGAIAEYVQLVTDQPDDWNSMNALGDLYVRAGHSDHAVAWFTTFVVLPSAT